jgi:transcriptional regulator with XRE-family HTH domain
VTTVTSGKDFRPTAGSNIIAARLELGWTQGDLVRRTGFSRELVSRWENAHQLPTWANLDHLASVLGKTPGWFLDDHSKAKR